MLEIEQTVAHKAYTRLSSFSKASIVAYGKLIPVNVNTSEHFVTEFRHFVARKQFAFRVIWPRREDSYFMSKPSPCICMGLGPESTCNILRRIILSDVQYLHSAEALFAYLITTMPANGAAASRSS